jgi:DNA polymerase III delta prime subunit
MHAARAYVVRKVSALSKVPFWSAVIFPYIPFNFESEEWQPWQVIDSRLYRTRPLSQSIQSVLGHARAFLAVPGRAPWFDPDDPVPSVDQCDDLVGLLRPRFEFFQSPRARMEQLDSAVKRFTTEQFSALDAMQDNRRVLFEGPAGTGKTVLALEAARRACLAGRRVLVLCFNRLLSRGLESELRPLGREVTVSTLHQSLLKTANASPPPAPDAEFWRTGLPSAAIGRLVLSGDESMRYDELVVDEAQDIIGPLYLDYLDVILRGGLSAGRWRMFGDFERQAIFGLDAETSRAELEDRCSRGVVRYSLRQNCRNTPRIAEFAQLLGGMEPGYTRVLRPDDGVDPSLLYYDSKEVQQKLLSDALNALEAEGFSSDEVLVLSPRVRGAANALRQDVGWRDRLAPYGEDGAARFRFCTIQSFKGLEAPAVVVTDIEALNDDGSQALLYVAITRALHRLVVLAEKSTKAQARALVSAQLARTPDHAT